jgi:hypothetical protein
MPADKYLKQTLVELDLILGDNALIEKAAMSQLATITYPSRR